MQIATTHRTLSKAAAAFVAATIVTCAIAQQPLVGRSNQPRTPAVTGLYTGSQSGWAIYGSARAGYAGYFLGHGYFSRSLILAANPPTSISSVTARLLVDGDAIFTGVGLFYNNLTVGTATTPRQLTVLGTATITSNLTVGGVSQFNGNVTIGNGAPRNLAVTGNTSIGGTLTAAGATTLNSTLVVGGVSQFNQTLTVQGPLTANNTALFNGNVAIGSSGNPRQLTVTGSASVSGNTAVGGALQVAGAATLNNTLAVSGATTLNTLTATGATNLNNTLSVSGATTLNNSLTVGGASQFNGNVAIGSNGNARQLTVTGTAAVSGNTTIGGELTANANAQFNGNVTVGTPDAPRHVRVNGNLVVPDAGINTPTFVFIHQHTGADALETELNHPLLNGNPNAIIFVTYNATGNGSLAISGGIGVRYDPDTGRWYIYTLSGTNDILQNATFNVMIVTPN